MDARQALLELRRIVNESRGLHGAEFVDALDFNARLVTACRERGLIWGRD
jgi:hypothetical protein